MKETGLLVLVRTRPVSHEFCKSVNTADYSHTAQDDECGNSLPRKCLLNLLVYLLESHLTYSFQRLITVCCLSLQDL